MFESKKRQLGQQSPLISYLNSEVQAFDSMGHPALMQRFVLTHGQEFAASAHTHGWGAGEPGRCFRNAAILALENPGLRYVEGYGASRGLPLAIHHAWCIDDVGRVVDVTWGPSDDLLYVGVVFEFEELSDELERLRVYGLLDTGRGINTDLIFRKAPELEGVYRNWTRRHDQ